MLSQFYGALLTGFSTGMPSPPHLQRCSLSADASKMSLNSDEVTIPFSKFSLYPSGAIICNQITNSKRTTNTLDLASQCVLQGTIYRRRKDRILNLGTASRTFTGSSLKSGCLSSQACDRGPLASQQSKDGDQIGITVSLVLPTELGQTGNAENEG